MVDHALPAERLGLQVQRAPAAEPPAGAQTTAPAVRTREWTDRTRGGKEGKKRQVPEGIDPGWDFNAGQRRTVGVNGALVRKLEDVLSGEGKLLQGASAAARERRARIIVGRHVAGPGFRWFVERPRGVKPADRQARAKFIEATPVGVLRRDLAERIGADTPLVRLNERVMHKQQRSHEELPAADYVRVQAVLDDAEPVLQRTPDERDRWLFSVPRLFRALVEVEAGLPQLISAHRLSRKKKGRAD